MEMLIRHQIGTPELAADNMLDRFTEDLATLAGNDGLGGQVWGDVTDGRNGLLKLVLENYYNQRDQSFDHLALKKVPGGISLDLEEIAGGQAISGLKGHKELKSGLLNNISVGIHHKAAVEAIQGRLDDAQVWTLGAAQGRSLAFDGDERNDLVDATDSTGAQINGGGGNDILIGSRAGQSTLNGGEGDDILLAGQGGSTLDGGAGNDTLFAYNDDNDTLSGGEGKDIYYVSGGDTVIETGQDTEIYYGANKIRLVGGKAVKGMKDTWRSADGQFLWTRVGSDTFRVKGPDGGYVTIKDETQTVSTSSGGTGSGGSSGGGDSGGGGSGDPSSGGGEGGSGDSSNPGGSGSSDKTEKANPAGINLPGSEDEEDPPIIDPTIIPDSGEDAKKAPPTRYDPLTLDLDHDGLETVGTGEPGSVLFDHDADGVKTGSGWVKPDDGLLVLDRNRNGRIDNGRELFGDATLKADGTLAKDGFDALADLDSNQDGKVDALDAAFANLRVWRDLNADGVSSSNELFTLQQLGIAGFNVARTSNAEVLDNGNRIADLGTYYHTDGSLDQMGTTGQMADIDLVADTYHREFTDTITVPAELQGLPDLQGSGRVRDLLQAAALSPALAQALSQFVATDSRADQQAQVQNMLHQWADTADFKTSREQAAETGGTVLFQFSNSQPVKVDGQWQYSTYAQDWLRRLDTFETFWGQSFVSFAAGANNGATSIRQVTLGGENVTLVSFNVNQLDIMERAFDAFAASVYEGLAQQTRYLPFFDAIKLVVGEQDFHFDTTGLAALIGQRLAGNPVEALQDLIGFTRAGEQALTVAGLEPWRWLEGYLGDARYAAAVTQALAPFQSGDSLNNFLLGHMGYNLLQGNGGDDVLHGMGGDDTLNGGAGDDLLDGGTGNDRLSGGAGRDTYLLERGTGVDRVATGSRASATEDVIRLGAGIRPEEVELRRIGSDLDILVNNPDGSADRMVVEQYFGDFGGYRVSQMQFADGTVWDSAEMEQRFIQYGTDAGEYLHVADVPTNRVFALGGDDIVFGGTGDDILDGGAGNDTLYGGEGDDLLNGGIGNDWLSGGVGRDTYLLERGTGVDRIDTESRASATEDVIRLGAGIRPEEVELRRFGSDLDILVNNPDGSADRMVVEQYFGDFGGYRVSQMQFADGTVWDRAEMEQRFIQYGTDAGEYLHVADVPTNRVFALGGDDTVFGGTGDDILDGGTGEDRLHGGGGHDTFVLERGSGRDWAFTDSRTLGVDDVIRLGADIRPEEVELRRYGTNLDVIVNNPDGSTDRMVVVEYFAGNPVSQVLFGDGTAWDRAELERRFVHYGSDAAETLSGADVPTNRIYGLGGDDSLFGGSGDNVLDGGTGNDWLWGGEGRNTYMLERGTGYDRIKAHSAAGSVNDVIRLGADIRPEEVELRRYANNLDVIVNNPDGSNDRLVVERYFTGDVIGQVQFGDGTVWDRAELERRFVQYGTDAKDALTAANVVSNRILAFDGDDTVFGGTGVDHVWGGSGNDTLHGGAGDDVLDGGAGNDTLYGGDGRDTYVLERGSGTDRVIASNAAGGVDDVVRLGAGIAAEDVELRRYGSNLHVIVNNSDGTNDRMVVERYFDGYTIGQVQFDDGTAWNRAELEGRFVHYGSESGDSLSAANVVSNRIYALGGNDTVSGGTGTDEIHGGDGDDNLFGYAGDDVLIGGAGNDRLSGGDGRDTYVLERGFGTDRVIASSAAGGVDDVIRLGAGIAAEEVELRRYGSNLHVIVNNPDGTNDRMVVERYFDGYTIGQVQFGDGMVWDRAELERRFVHYGSEGADTINAANVPNNRILALGGNDVVYGGTGADEIHGGEGDDTLYGKDGDDVLIGGAGVNRLYGGAGRDTYVLERGTGLDWIYADSTTSGVDDTVRMGAGIRPEEVDLRRYGNNLDIRVNNADGSTDLFAVDRYFNGSPISQVVFDDGTVWDRAELERRFVHYGSEGADTINAANVPSNRILALAGNDTVYGASGADTILGGDGNDTLYGKDGDDVLDGGVGTDRLEGGNGNDTYQFGAGFGADRIVENDATSGNTDLAQFADAASDQLWFRRVGSDLEVSVIGTGDKVTVASWYSGTKYHVEQFKTADGKMLLDSQVDALVSAMAGFAPPDAGQTTLPDQYREQLQPVLAANWH
ncbi:calcium-binding protein [Chitiniphilus eburneus]|uniref:calcium-binding protein n=1 Tax=Chitiniphilus eburneus TaxID=2571148 RepID=UPI001B7FD14A|nr:calcium-binding protein [Chitiniphilus eburneus]